MRKTREPQYQGQIVHDETHGAGRMGLTSSYLWQHDSKHVLFTLARYKFVAKMLEGKKTVAEVGCGDGFGTRLVAATTGRVDGYDFDPVFIADARQVNAHVANTRFIAHDILIDPLPHRYDAMYALDVLEHIAKRKETAFLKNIMRSLKPHSLCIFGTPNLTSQQYASLPSRQGHVNCKDHVALRKLFEAHFHHTLLFGMNDEVIHTGFPAMAHYLFAIGLEPKSGSRGRRAQS